MRKALLIGTTGMLAEAAGEMAADAGKSVLAARHASAFRFGNLRLDASLRKIDADYARPSRFLGLIRPEALFDMALTWIRPQAEELRNALARMMAKDALLVEVMGSGASRPGGFADKRAKAMRLFPHIRYAQVILGFVIEDGKSRWLTHEEISAAAIKAIRSGAPRTIAGRLEPWEKRP